MRHVIILMRRHDLTNKKTMTMTMTMAMVKTLFLMSEKEDLVAQIRGVGGRGNLGNAQKKTFFFQEVFPKDQ